MHYRHRRNIRVVIMEVLKEEDTKEVPKEDMGVVAAKDMGQGEVDLSLVSIVEKLAMYQGFVLNHT
jgi:hypothetical protein